MDKPKSILENEMRYSEILRYKGSPNPGQKTRPSEDQKIRKENLLYYEVCRPSDPQSENQRNQKNKKREKILEPCQRTKKFVFWCKRNLPGV